MTQVIGASADADRAGGLRPEPAAQSQPIGAHSSRWPSVEWDDDGYPCAEDDGFASWLALPFSFRHAGHFLLEELPFAATQCCCSCEVEDIDGGKRISFSTGGWSGAESLLGLIEQRLDTSYFMQSWRRGGHYVFEIRNAYLRDSDGSPEGGDAEGGSMRSTTARGEAIAQTSAQGDTE